jgi:hypothetical protein
MAIINLAINIPDAQQARALAGLKTFWTVDGVVPTNAQVIENLRKATVDMVREIVLSVERSAATKAAADGVSPIDAT